MLVQIRGHRFNTEHVKRHWKLHRKQGVEVSEGDLYVSHHGQWYAFTPASRSGRHEWEILSPEKALERFGPYMQPEQLEEIAAFAGLASGDMTEH
jgi:hypothetical protein